MNPLSSTLTATRRTALVTGGSAGLGRALVTALAARAAHGAEPWTVVTDARDADALFAAHGARPGVVALPGDVTDRGHREDLARAVEATGRLDLLVNNASTLGPVPLRPVVDLDESELDGLWLTNVAAPHALLRRLVPLLLVTDGVAVSVSSDAAVEHYETWGGYAATKAALDHLTLTLAAETPGLRAYAVDPGDMRTAMHQAAFPGEDIGDRPTPASVVPHLLGLVDRAAPRPPAGRYRAADLPVATTTARTNETDLTSATEVHR